MRRLIERCCGRLHARTSAEWFRHDSGSCSQTGSGRMPVIRVEMTTDAVELPGEPATKKMEKMQKKLKGSEEVPSLRAESNRVRQRELTRGAALNPQADTA